MTERISAVDHALCQAASRELRRGRPYVAGRMPLTITTEQAAERHDYRLLNAPWPSAISSATTATITTCSSWRGGGRRRRRRARMGEHSAISWTDGSFSPWFGCTRVSAACDHCYAEDWSRRYRKAEWGPHAKRWRSAASSWQAPLAWDRKAAKAGRRTVVFVSEVSDVFDNKAADEWRADLWVLMRQTPHLLWLVLTKRPQNMAKMLPADWPLANVWLGVTAEDQVEADRRVSILAATPAAGRFVSCEPLLGPVDLALWFGSVDYVIAGCESRGHAPDGRPISPGSAPCATSASRRRHVPSEATRRCRPHRAPARARRPAVGGNAGLRHPVLASFATGPA